MVPNPLGNQIKINAVIDGWEENAPGATLSGMTLAQFKARVKPSLDVRDSIQLLEAQLAAARVARDNADVTSLETVLNIVNSVRGDAEYGEDSALYASFGYVRKSQRKSGLTRATQAPAPTALKAAA